MKKVVIMIQHRQGLLNFIRQKEQYCNIAVHKTEELYQNIFIFQREETEISINEIRNAG